MSRQNCPAPQKDCPFKKPFSDRHHLYWPRAEYEAAGAVPAAWRELGHLSVQLCRCEHNEIHATTEPPAMPDRQQMIDDLIASGQPLNCAVRKAIASAERAQHVA